MQLRAYCGGMLKLLLRKRKGSHRDVNMRMKEFAERIELTLTAPLPALALCMAHRVGGIQAVAGRCIALHPAQGQRDHRDRPVRGRRVRVTLSRWPQLSLRWLQGALLQALEGDRRRERA